MVVLGTFLGPGHPMASTFRSCPDPRGNTGPIFLAQDQWQHPRASRSSQQQKVCSSALKKMFVLMSVTATQLMQLCHGQGTLTGLLIAVALVPKVAID